MITAKSAALSPQKFQEYEELTDYARYAVNLHPIWLSTYIETFGCKEVIIEAWDNISGKLCGLLPLAQKNFQEIRFLTIRRLVPLGYQPTDFFDILSVPGKEENVTKAFANWLKENKNSWDQLMINLIPNETPCWRPFVKHLNNVGFYPEVTTNHSFLKIDTTKSYDDYLNSLGTKKRKELRYYKNKMLKTGSFKVQNIKSDYGGLVDDFVQIYSDRRSSIGQSDPFQRQPELFQFFKIIIPKYMDRDWLRLTVLKLDRKIIAYSFQLIYKNVVYYYMPTFLKEFSNLSPGKVLLAEFATS